MPHATVSDEHFTLQVSSKATLPEGTMFDWARRLVVLLARLIGQFVEAALRARLDEELGPPHAPGSFETVGCPACGSARATRKTFRSRTVGVKTLGKVSVRRPYVRCRDCGRHFAPYDGCIGLEAHQRWDPALILQGIQRAVQTTYRTASRMLEGIMAPKTLWRHLTQTTPSPTDHGPTEGTTLVDATRVPRWRSSGQQDLALAHRLSRDGPADRWDRQVVGGVVGTERTLKDLLKGAGVQRVLHDGKLALDSIVPECGRCRWHVGYTVRYLLYQDGISGESNHRLRRSLMARLWDDEQSASAYRASLRKWVHRHRDEAPQTTGHVEAALPGLMAVRQHPERFGLHTTSPIEREMVEINKRFENGGGWTRHGGEAMLMHHQMLRHQPDRWHTLMRRQLGNDDAPHHRNSQL